MSSVRSFVPLSRRGGRSINEQPESIHVVRQWIRKAEDDLLVVERLSGDGPADAVCFHAQQCVDKYIKAVLSLSGVDFPKTRDIEHLVGLLPRPHDLDLTVAEQRRLTRYATVTRYPGDYDPITLEEARDAVEIAQRARACLRAFLPPEVLGRAG